MSLAPGKRCWHYAQRSETQFIKNKKTDQNIQWRSLGLTMHGMMSYEVLSLGAEAVLQVQSEDLRSAADIASRIETGMRNSSNFRVVSIRK